MNFRTLILTLVVALIALLAALNWATLSQPTLVSLGVSHIEAPLGLMMLGLTVLLGVVFVAYVLALQGSVLLETRRHTKELQAQRELADKAEASRFTELRTEVLTLQRENQRLLLERLDALEVHLQARVQESDNATAAYVGQLEDQLRTTGRSRTSDL